MTHQMIYKTTRKDNDTQRHYHALHIGVRGSWLVMRTARITGYKKRRSVHYTRLEPVSQATASCLASVHSSRAVSQSVFTPACRTNCMVTSV